MFKKLRKKMLLNSMVVLGSSILILFVGIFMINYFQIRGDIADKIDVAAARFNDPLGSNSEGRVIPQGCIILVVDSATNEVFASSNFEDYYTEEELKEIVGFIMKYNSDETQGRIRSNGKSLSYKKLPVIKSLLETDITRIVIYDYSSDRANMLNLLLALGLCYLAGLIICFVFVYKFVDDSVKPIELAFKKQRELVANASHELKTPITVIKTSLSLIDEDGDAEENKKWLSSIRGQTERMSSLIKEMLELAKMDREGEKIALEQINISKLVQGVVLDMEVVAFERGLKLISEITPDLKASGEKNSCEKIAYILIENALKYTNPNGTIRVKVYQDRRKRTVFSVLNTGEGIKRESIPKLFDRFYRINESHTNQEKDEKHSFGLGLAILNSLVTTLGAEINVQSEVGKFAEFIVTYNK